MPARRNPGGPPGSGGPGVDGVAALRSALSPSSLLAVARRPGLWWSALRLAVVLRSATPEYLRFREHTMFGPEGGRLDGEQLVAYLAWCRDMRRSPVGAGSARYRRGVLTRGRSRRR